MVAVVSALQSQMHLDVFLVFFAFFAFFFFFFFLWLWHYEQDDLFNGLLPEKICRWPFASSKCC